MKKIISALLSTLMLFSLAFPAFAVSIESNDNISICETLNTELTPPLRRTATAMSNSAEIITSATINVESITDGKGVGTVAFSYNNRDYQFTATGEIEQYSNGFIGVLQGIHIIEGIPQLVTADFAKATNGDAIVIISIGYITDDTVVPIFIYGEYTEAIQNLYAQEQSILETNSVVSEQSENAIQPQAFDSTIYYQGSSPIHSNGLSVGSLSVFHTNMLQNQGYTTIYAKVNTNNAAVVSYIKSNYQVALDTAIANADKFNIRVAVNDARVYNATNSYYPQEGKTTQSLLIPVYVGSKLGIQTFSINLVTSSITFNATKYGASAKPNILDWELFKSQGFYDTDGDYQSQSGISAYADFVCSGNITSNVDVSVNCRGAIRYRCQYLPNGSATQMISFHLTTGTTSKTTVMTLIP